jgi:hypothetical protein
MLLQVFESEKGHSLDMIGRIVSEGPERRITPKARLEPVTAKHNLV